MPQDQEDTGQNTVSQEAFDRVKHENAQLKEQTTAATRALEDYRKRDAARAALKDKVADPDSVADLITPHLADVPTEQVAEHVASEEFKPRLAAFAAAEAPPTPGEGAEGEGDGETSTASSEPTTPFGGPSPGQDGGTQPAGQKQPLVVGSDDWNALVRENKTEAIEAAYKEGRVVEPSRPW